MIHDINIQLIDMNTKIREQVVENMDGSYTIFLNSRLNVEQQNNGYIHALKHILQLDFEKSNVDTIEYYAHLYK